jgi:UDP-glucuronate decarboxylase
MEYEEDIPGPLNLGNPEETTIVELAQLIIDLAGSKSRIVHRALPADDPVRRKPDITKARKILDWQPRVDLKQGILKTMEYFDHVLSTVPALHKTASVLA